jgi:sensor histidine kinase YesM
MERRILISENERSRILGLHENRRMKEWGLINEQVEGALSAELKAKNIKITGLEEPPLGELSNWSLIDGSKITAGYYGFVVNNAEQSTTYYMDNGMTLKGERKNSQTNDMIFTKLPNWTDKPIAGAKTVLVDTVVQAPMTTLKPTLITGSTGTTQLQGVVDTTNMASRRDIRQGYRQGKKDVRELEKELNQHQNTIKRMANKMTPEQRAQYDAKIAQLQTQINQSAS